VSDSKIRQVENQVFDRTIRLFKSGSDSQTFPLIKEAEDNPAAGWNPFLIY
jgi:hypothetical protein